VKDHLHHEIFLTPWRVYFPLLSYQFLWGDMVHLLSFIRNQLWNLSIVYYVSYFLLHKSGSWWYCRALVHYAILKPKTVKNESFFWNSNGYKFCMTYAFQKKKLTCIDLIIIIIYNVKIHILLQKYSCI
jgi:hypothetical protein